MFLLPYRDENPSHIFPFVTLLLIGLNVAVYIAGIWGHYGGDALVREYGFVPRLFWFRPLTLVTSTFLHAGLLHLTGNMWFLWLYGDNVEERLGRFRYLLLYLSAGIIGNLLHGATGLFADKTPVIGASGAVAGVMGYYMPAFPRARIRCLFLLIIYPVFFRISSALLLGGWMVVEFFSAYFSLDPHVAHWAHVGGFALGVWSAYTNKRY